MGNIMEHEPSKFDLDTSETEAEILVQMHEGKSGNDESDELAEKW
jgi:hypothetical protein